MTLQASNIELHGKAFNTNQIAAFIENLGKVPEFQEPRLRDTSKQGPVYSFVITFNFSVAEPPAAQQPAAGEAPAAAAAPPAGT
jgi:Tfp pilus assembly protein PilN